MLIRIHTIRETSFVSSGYAIAEAIAIILAIGLIFVKIDPFYEALFFVSAITFLQIEISLKPLDDLKLRLEEKIIVMRNLSAPAGN